MRGGATAASVEAALLAMDAYGRAFEMRRNAERTASIDGGEPECCHAWATLRA